jgi:hypothetical protein
VLLRDLCVQLRRPQRWHRLRITQISTEHPGGSDWSGLLASWGDVGNFGRFARSAILFFSVKLRVLLDCRPSSRHRPIPVRSTAAAGSVKSGHHPVGMTVSCAPPCWRLYEHTGPWREESVVDPPQPTAVRCISSAPRDVSRRRPRQGCSASLLITGTRPEGQDRDSYGVARISALSLASQFGKSERALSIDMIRDIHAAWGIPLDALVGTEEYAYQSASRAFGVCPRTRSRSHPAIALSALSDVKVVSDKKRRVPQAPATEPTGSGRLPGKP